MGHVCRQTLCLSLPLPPAMPGPGLESKLHNGHARYSLTSPRFLRQSGIDRKLERKAKREHVVACWVRMQFSQLISQLEFAQSISEAKVSNLLQGSLVLDVLGFCQRDSDPCTCRRMSSLPILPLPEPWLLFSLNCPNILPSLEHDWVGSIRYKTFSKMPSSN